MEFRKLKDLKKLEGNPRTIKDDDFQRLVKSIKDNPDYFEARPLILSDRTGELVIIAGNQRYEAAKELKLKEVPTFLIKDLTEEREREIIIRDNISNGQWNFDILANEWDTEQLADWGVEIPNFETTVLEAEEDDFSVPEGGIETDIVLGDLFEIGEQRLLCGSSTNSEDVKKLMGGGNCNIMITDPPYGVNLDQSWRNGVGTQKHNGNKNTIKNDDIADWTSAYSLFTGTIAYVWHATKFTDVIMKNLRDCNFEPNQMLILNKSVMVMGRNDYHWKHEPCWYAIKKGSNHSWVGDRKQVTVIDAVMPSARSQKSNEERTEHPTQKPIVCMSIPMSNHSGDIYDPFLGSGTTMVAANQLKRKCYGMELDPKYCQVIVDRMRKLDPTLVIKKNGINIH